MIEKPTDFPRKSVNGSELKPLPELLLGRRATRSFKPDPIPDEYVDAIVRLGTQAPSGYNLQPWRFLVVREAENRRRLMQASFNQPKVGEAPVVIIALGMKNEWRAQAEEVFKEGAARRAGSRDWENYLKQAVGF